MKNLLFIVIILGSTCVFSQNKGITYQAVIYQPGGQNLPGYDLDKVPMDNRNICLKFSFLDENSSLEYQEEVKTKTDEFGMVNITIGSGNQTGGYASSYAAIVWSAAEEKSLKVALDATGLCSQFDELSVDKLESVPFAYAATTAGNVSGLVALINGGTAATTAAGARTNLGLGNVDNTADADKPVSTATQTALNAKANSADVTTSLALKADLASPTFTGTVSGIDKTMVGLGNVDNTTDLLKPVSTATQTALNAKANEADVTTSLALKADLASPTFTGTVSGIDKTMVGLGNVDNTTDLLKPVSTATQTALNAKANSTDVTTSLALKANLASPTFTGTVTIPTGASIIAPTGLVKGDVGLGSVDNTTDLLKPVSTATQTALNAKANSADVTTSLALKANLASPTFTGTVSGIDKTMVGLGNVDNTTDLLKPVSTATQTALNAKANSTDVTTSLALKANLASPTFTGTVTIPTGASIIAPTGLVKADVGLGNVDNTTDLLKPVSTATQTALNAKANSTDVTTSLALKANLASPTFTGTVSGIDKTMVGLGNVDNTTDLLKPVSTATQTALNAKANSADVTTSLALKADLASPTFTGTVTLPSVNKVAITAPTNGATLTIADGSSLITAGGAFATTLTSTAATNVTLPTTGTLATTAYADAAAGAKVADEITDGTTTIAPSQNAVFDALDLKANSTVLTNYVTTNTAQTITEEKTFSKDLTVNGIKVGLGAGNVSSNTAIGSAALTSNTTGNSNIAVGMNTLSANQTGSYSTAIGVDALKLSTGGSNTAIGHRTLSNNTSGDNNTATGADALKSNTTGVYNTAYGSSTLLSNSTGSGNTAIGYTALFSNLTDPSSKGDDNTAIGNGALKWNTTGSNNTASGTTALLNNSTGSYNAAIGNDAGSYLANGSTDNTTSDYSVYLGSNTKASASNAQNEVVIGYNAIGAGDNTIQLGNTSITNVKTSGTITAAGMGLGVSAPNASAILEASSTTQGFLPPRLTTTERDAIANPVAGLTIWNSTNTQLEVYDGSYWKNMVGLLVSPLQVGDEYGGGKVFYIFGPSDNGYIKGQTHGLIAATEDQTTDAGIKWFPDKFYGATGTYIGLGLPNTLGIITSAIVLGTTNMSSFAAGLANSYRGGGYIDWFLPSRDELNLLYQAKDDIGGFATNQTPGVSPAYWSSTQKGGISFTNFTSFANGVTSARLQFFNTGGSPVQPAGTITDTGIDNPRRVRAIRIF
jgi:hypothetical protein